MENSPANDLIVRAQALAQAHGKIWDPRFGRIITFWVGPPLSFPKHRKKKILAVEEVDDEYLIHFIKRYYREREGTVVMQPVSTRADPVVDEVLKAYKNVAPADLQGISRAHRISMQAENMVGKLLERYVAPLLESKGWVWCAGETLRSVDFMKDEDTSHVRLLQIKNRSNSENSSSSAIRVGTTIEKWYRINSSSGTTRWDCLPENEENVCSEQGFYDFVRREATKQRRVEELPFAEASAEDNGSSC